MAAPPSCDAVATRPSVAGNLWLPRGFCGFSTTSDIHTSLAMDQEPEYRATCWLQWKRGGGLKRWYFWYAKEDPTQRSSDHHMMIAICRMEIGIDCYWGMTWAVLKPVPAQTEITVYCKGELSCQNGLTCLKLIHLDHLPVISERFEVVSKHLPFFYGHWSWFSEIPYVHPNQFQIHCKRARRRSLVRRIWCEVHLLFAIYGTRDMGCGVIVLLESWKKNQEYKNQQKITR